MSKNKKSIAAKRKVREVKRKESGVKEHGSVKAVASAIILAIEDDYIFYRQFKEIQAMIDAKYHKPEWVPEKVIKND